MFFNWRGCQEYKALGLPLSTTSNEACKLYDATLTQFVGWYSDASMGGIENCVGRMFEADPGFVMGHVLGNGLVLSGTNKSIDSDPEFKKAIDSMVTLASTSPINQREKMHVQAIKNWANGEMKLACDIWEDILLDNPLDILAMKFVQLGYFYSGQHTKMRDYMARCLPSWKDTTPLYGYTLGMYAFGLEETGFYEKAEKTARKALEINQSDAWSTHVITHVMEMEGRQKEGIQFLDSTVNDWTKCQFVAGHNYWHWALYNVELNDHQGALDIFDSQMAPRCTVNDASMLDLTDATSLLFRLEMEGVNVGERWNDVFEICRPYVDGHVQAYNDVHILMGCLGANETETAGKMMNSLKDFVRDGTGDNRKITESVALPLCEAFVAYNAGEYAQAVDLVFPIRYTIQKMGGSHAQDLCTLRSPSAVKCRGREDWPLLRHESGERDVFNLFLIDSAMKSSRPKHRQLARHLLLERKALKENAPMTDRLTAHAMAFHEA